MEDDIKPKLFGKLTYVRDEYVHKEHVYCRWKCACENEIIARKNNVLYGTTTSCGCSRKRGNSKLWKGVGEVSKTFWYRLIAGAKKRKIEVSVTMDDAWKIFQQQNRRCAITGELLYFAEAGNNEVGGTASLDRIDSTKGYTPDNIQWVHKEVNMMKRDLPLPTFFTWCKKVVDKNPTIK